MEKFLEIYQHLNKDNLHLLRDVYAEEIKFEDPVHKIEGLDNLIKYFEIMYENVQSVRFDFAKPLVFGAETCIQWNMHFSHRKLRSGEMITVPGMSYVVFNDDQKVCEHRDYFDLGSMIYEHLPVIGFLIRAVKGRVGE